MIEAFIFGALVIKEVAVTPFVNGCDVECAYKLGKFSAVFLIKSMVKQHIVIVLDVCTAAADVSVKTQFLYSRRDIECGAA